MSEKKYLDSLQRLRNLSRAGKEGQTAAPSFVRVLADPEQGLTKEQVEERIRSGAVNTPPEGGTLSLKQIIRENVCTYYNLIFLLITISLCLVRAYQALTFLPVILANMLTGIIQEWRSMKALEEMKLMNESRVTVIRDGETVSIRSEEIVSDEIALLSGGDQIPADGEVVLGEALVNESLLTGEPDEIPKKAGDSLLSGSYLVSGSCRVRFLSVGEDSYVSRLSKEAHSVKKGEQSEMIRSLDRLVKVIGILIIPFAALLFYSHFYVQHNTLKQSVTATDAAIIGMIPEGLYLLASVAMAVSVGILSRNKVLVHNMKSIETLARADVLCVDKTGTITENTMKVDQLLPLGENAPEEDALRDLIRRYVSLMNPDSSTMKAMKEAFPPVGKTKTENTDSGEEETVVPFSSVYKYSAACFDGNVYVLGAPELLLKETYAAYDPEIRYHAQRGYRVVLFGQTDRLPSGALDEAVSPLGLVLLSNPVREHANEIFSYFARQNVRVKVISGDSALTASEVARKAGIEGAQHKLDVSGLSDLKLASVCEYYTVFGRVSPQQKRVLIHAMKKAGHTVAMTGDGVNDVLALRDADCSVAMASGSDAAAHAAQMVLVDSDFSRMPSVVNEGRRVVGNIQRTASLFLVKNIFSVLMTLLVILLHFHYPLEPSQVSLISGFTIGVPAFLLSMEANREQIRGHFMSNVMRNAFPAGLTDFIAIAVTAAVGGYFGIRHDQLTTVCATLFGVVGSAHLFRVAMPMTLFHKVLWGVMTGGMILCMTFLGKTFMFVPLGVSAVILLVCAILLCVPLYLLMCIVVEKVLAVASEAIRYLQR